MPHQKPASSTSRETPPWNWPPLAQPSTRSVRATSKRPYRTISHHRTLKTAKQKPHYRAWACHRTSATPQYSSHQTPPPGSPAPPCPWMADGWRLFFDLLPKNPKPRTAQRRQIERLIVCHDRYSFFCGVICINLTKNPNLRRGERAKRIWHTGVAIRGRELEEEQKPRGDARALPH